MSKLTIVLTNWRRLENLNRIIAGLRKQTVRPEVFVWDNSGEGVPGVEWCLSSSSNIGCAGRWHMGALANTPYVGIMDDDYNWTDKTALAVALDIVDRRQAPVGFMGRNLISGVAYGSLPLLDQGWCDILLGRLWIFERALLDRVALPRKNRWLMEDDIFMSSQVPKKWIAPRLRSMLVNYETGSEALNKRPNHYRSRQRARIAFFGK